MDITLVRRLAESDQMLEIMRSRFDSLRNSGLHLSNCLSAAKPGSPSSEALSDAVMCMCIVYDMIEQQSHNKNYSSQE